MGIGATCTRSSAGRASGEHIQHVSREVSRPFQSIFFGMPHSRPSTDMPGESRGGMILSEVLLTILGQDPQSVSTSFLHTGALRAKLYKNQQTPYEAHLPSQFHCEFVGDVAVKTKREGCTITKAWRQNRDSTRSRVMHLGCISRRVGNITGHHQCTWARIVLEKSMMTLTYFTIPHYFRPPH